MESGKAFRMKSIKAGTPTWTSPEYLSFCEAQSRRVRIRYADAAGWNTAVLSATWKRGAPEIKAGMRMSTSSGPKDYFINDVIALFEANEVIQEIALLILRGTPFLIMRVDSQWYDRSRPEPRPVIVETLNKMERG